MKKLFLFAIVVLAAAIFLAPPASALGLIYRQTGTGCAAGDQNAYSRGGVTTEILYHIGGAASGGGAFETNHGAGFPGCLAGSGQTDYPYAAGTADRNDNGNLSCRAATTCGSSTTPGNLDSDTSLTGSGNAFLHASVFVLNGVNGAAGYTTAAAGSKTQTDGRVLHILYDAYQFTTGTDNTSTLNNVAGNFTPYAVSAPGAARITSTPPAAEGAHTSFVRLQFPNTIMPGPITPTSRSAGVVAYAGTARHGVRIYRSINPPATTVAADFTLATNTVINVGNATVRFDGVTPNGKYVGPALSGGFFFNDFSVDGNTNVNYIAVPVLVPDQLAGNANGIPIHFAGSWQNPGQNTGAGSGLPTPVRVTSFESSFDPRTGKVTLNWRTSTEDDLSGFNIWRDTTVNGKPLGQRTFVAFVQAKTGLANVGADYSFVDTVDMSKYQRIARGKPIDVSYSIEEVSLSGNVTPAGTTNFTMSPKLAGTTR